MRWAIPHVSVAQKAADFILGKTFFADEAETAEAHEKVIDAAFAESPLKEAA